MYQSFALIGHIVKEPEMKYLPSGEAVTSLVIGVNRTYKEKKKTLWVRASVFGKRAEVCNEYLHKGRRVFVAGVISPDEDGNPHTWLDKEGKPHSRLDMIAETVVFLDKKEKDGVSETENEEF